MLTAVPTPTWQSKRIWRVTSTVVFTDLFWDNMETTSLDNYSCWLFSVLNNAHIPMKVSGPQKTHNDTNTKNKWVCSTTGFSIGMRKVLPTAKLARMTFMGLCWDPFKIGDKLWTIRKMLTAVHHKERQSKIVVKLIFWINVHAVFPVNMTMQIK